MAIQDHCSVPHPAVVQEHDLSNGRRKYCIPIPQPPPPPPSLHVQHSYSHLRNGSAPSGCTVAETHQPYASSCAAVSTGRSCASSSSSSFFPCFFFSSCPRILFPDVPRPSPPRPQKVRLCCCIVELFLSGLDPRTLASCSAYSYIHTHSLPPCAPSRRRRRCCCPQSLATAAASRSSPGLASPNARLISTSVPVPEPRDCLLCCGVGVCAALDEQIRKLENFCHLHCCFDSTQTATTRHASPPSSCDPKVLHPADMR